jgi:DNA-binding CsgD family transcriptional regulator
MFGRATRSATTGAPSFTRGSDGLITSWNRAAERLLGHRAVDVTGCRCHEVLAGRDVFGNVYCGERCPVARMATRREEVHPFVLKVHDARGRLVDVRVSILALEDGPGPWPELVCVMEPFAARTAVVTHHPTADGTGVRTARLGTPLSARELQVLRMVAAGRPTTHIAATLGVSRHTVRNHVAACLRKLDCHSRLEAVSVARRLDLL